jgi:hypothetical protein
MRKGIHRTQTGVAWRRRAAPLLLGAILLVSFPTDGRCGRFVGTGSKLGGHDRLNYRWHSGPDERRGGTIRISNGKAKQRSAPENWDQNRRLSPEEKARLGNQYRQWQSLPPERRQDLRRRMERWKELPPGDRDLLRRRYQQWRQLPPEEQQRMRERLNRWNQLPPEEQERIRQRFRRPPPKP